MNIENAINLTKYAINYIIIAIINCYKIAISKAFDLIKTNIKNTFLISWC